MKIKLFAITIFLLITNSLSTTEYQDTTRKKLVEKKWKVAFLEMEGMKIPAPDGDKNLMWMYFHKDGKHDINLGTEVKEGTWKLSKNKDSIFFTTSTGSERKMKLIKLTDTQLDLGLQNDGKDVTMFLEHMK